VERLDSYIAALRERCTSLPDKREGRNTQYSMSDIGLAAFSVFFMQSPSFLAHQTALEELRGRSNANTLFGMTKIPSDNHIRQMLDGAPTDHFDEAFARIVRDLDASGGLKSMRRLGGRVLIALDGSEHFCSRKINCPHCSTRKRSDGGTEYFHSFVGATLVAPGCGFRHVPATHSDLIPATDSDRVPATHSDPVPATYSDRVPATLLVEVAVSDQG